MDTCLPMRHWLTLSARHMPDAAWPFLCFDIEARSETVPLGTLSDGTNRDSSILTDRG